MTATAVTIIAKTIDEVFPPIRTVEPRLERPGLAAGQSLGRAPRRVPLQGATTGRGYRLSFMAVISVFSHHAGTITFKV